MVASGALLVLCGGLPTELAAPDDERLVEESALFEVAEESCHGKVGVARVKLVVFHEVAVRVPVVIGVIASRVDLDETDATFHQAPREETFLAEVFRALVIESVEFANVRGFGGKIECLGCCGLHAEGEFVAINPCGKIGVLGVSVQMLFVQLIKRADQQALLRFGHPFAGSEIKDGRA